MAWQIVQRRKEIANKFTEALPASCAPGSAWHPATLARRQMKANKQQHVLAHCCASADRPGAESISSFNVWLTRAKAMLLCVVIRADSSLVRNLQAAVCSWACKERDHVVFAPFGPTVTPCSRPLAWGGSPVLELWALGTLMLPREGCERQQADICTFSHPLWLAAGKTTGTWCVGGIPKACSGCCCSWLKGWSRAPLGAETRGSADWADLETKKGWSRA